MDHNKRAKAYERIAKGISFIGASLANIDEDKTEAVNPNAEYVDYKEDYRTIVQNQINSIYRSNANIADNSMNFIQPVPQQYNNTGYQPQQFIQYQPVQVEPNNYSDFNTVDISKYIKSQKKDNNATTLGNNPIFTILTDEKKSPILTKLEIMCCLLGRLIDAVEANNELLSGRINEVRNNEYTQDYGYANIPDEVTEADIKTAEEELAELERLEASMVVEPPPPMDVE